MSNDAPRPIWLICWQGSSTDHDRSCSYWSASLTGTAGISTALQRDFTMLDDGVQQEVTLDDSDAGLPPISLAIVIQTSGISTPALAKIRRIGSVIQPLVIGPRGTAAVMSIARSDGYRTSHRMTQRFRMRWRI
jgi:hypothetical protein